MDHDPPGWDEHPDDEYPQDEVGAEPDALDGGHDAGAADEHVDGPDELPGVDAESGFDADHDEVPGLSYSDEYDAELTGDRGDDPGADQQVDDLLPEPVSGVHPDLDVVGDDPRWDDDPFPPPLDIGEAPEPVDGFPWSDPAVLGAEYDTGAAAPAGGPPPDELAAYDASDLPAGADAWQALAGSDDPATSSLARWWGG